MVFIRIRYGGKIETIPEISKMATIRQLEKEITELTDLSSKEQRLFFRGKELGKPHTPYTYQGSSCQPITRSTVYKKHLIRNIVEVQIEIRNGD